MLSLKVSDEKSLKYLDSKNQGDLIIGGHPIIFINDDGELETRMQESAFVNALKIYKNNGGKLVLWFSNSKNSHKEFLKKDIATGASFFKLSDLKEEVVTPYRDLVSDENLIENIHVVFQNQANGYVKNNLNSKKTDQNKGALEKLLLSKNENEYKTNCKGTFAGFLKLTGKMNKSASNILVCLGADNWSSFHDMAGGIVGAKNIMGLKQNAFFAYFDEGKEIPMMQCK